ncbi:hypothetical protein EJB05_03249, partial [Eragrostis curvula]
TDPGTDTVKQNPHRLDPEAQMRWVPDIPIPKNIAEAEELEAKMQESRKAMREEMKLLGEEFNDALKKANEEVRITKEFLRRKGAQSARSRDKFVNRCAAAAIAFTMFLIFSR